MAERCQLLLKEWARAVSPGDLDEKGSVEEQNQAARSAEGVIEKGSREWSEEGVSVVVFRGSGWQEGEKVDDQAPSLDTPRSR